MKDWGKRKLSDETIRKIASRIKEIPQGLKKATYKALAQEFGCGVSTVERIAYGYLTPGKYGISMRDYIKQ